MSKRNFIGSYNFELQYKSANTVLGKNKTANSDVQSLWFQFPLRLGDTPSFGGHNGAVMTTGTNIYTILVYNNERVSIKL